MAKFSVTLVKQSRVNIYSIGALLLLSAGRRRRTRRRRTREQRETRTTRGITTQSIIITWSRMPVHRSDVTSISYRGCITHTKRGRVAFTKVISTITITIIIHLTLYRFAFAGPTLRNALDDERQDS